MRIKFAMPTNMGSGLPGALMRPKTSHQYRERLMQDELSCIERQLAAIIAEREAAKRRIVMRALRTAKIALPGS